MSTPSDQSIPSAPKSPLSGAPIAPAPAPAPAPSVAPAAPGLSKPAFKVTRSPFAPKISGGTSGPLTGPMSIGLSTANAAPAAKLPTRKFASASGKITKEEGPALVVLDLIAAGVSVAAAVMMALAYFKQ
jgi:hypothetical protein